MLAERTARLVFSLLLMGILAFALFTSFEFHLRAKIFPIFAAAVGLLFCVTAFVLELRHAKASGAAPQSEQQIFDMGADTDYSTAITYLRALRYFGWIMGYYTVIALIGTPLATVVFLLVFLKVEAKARWWVAISITAALLYLVVFHLARMLGLALPLGLFDGFLSQIPVIRIFYPDY
jgi:hypothetical protein